MKNNREVSKKSWLFKLILDSKAISGFLILLLFLLIILVFTKVAYIFEPIGQFIAILGFPIILATVFYYLFKPFIDFAEKKGISRLISTIILFVILVALIIWGLVVLIPNIEKQILSFMNNVPRYMHVIDAKVRELLENPMYDSLRPQLDKFSGSINQKVIDYAQDFSTHAFSGFSQFLDRITTILVGIITMPFILFYLLKDGDKLLPYATSFLPVKWRKQTTNILREIDQQISSYIRGQVMIAMSVAVLFIIGFSIIGLDYTITIGISAGILNMIPYLGSFLAMIPAIILGIVAGPVMLIKVIIVFIIEQTIEGRVISPQILGSQLKIHPITIIFVLLTSGKLFGIFGVIVGIPLYASIKVIVTHLFKWYRSVSSFYSDEDKEMPDFKQINDDINNSSI
ncbi:MAG: AI-2E family transporter [Streptococcaceae bacterium]|jgi:predicted PurR-regulated permease PerM|nr:AI-2E family transporter [Streptococcaceae bacterium]